MASPKTRVESDSMGQIEVPADRYWGAQTQRSLSHFSIGQDRMPVEIVQAFGVIKKAAALANCELGVLDEERAGRTHNPRAGERARRAQRDRKKSAPGQEPDFQTVLAIHC